MTRSGQFEKMNNSFGISGLPCLTQQENRLSIDGGSMEPDDRLTVLTPSKA
jgi:hypothetical protein